MVRLVYSCGQFSKLQFIVIESTLTCANFKMAVWFSSMTHHA